MSTKLGMKDETLRALDANAREKDVYESRLQDYTVFPIYEQYNPLIFEDILYSRNQEAGSDGSQLLGLDVESGMSMSQLHKIPTRGYLDKKGLHSVRYQARFPWESDYTGFDPCLIGHSVGPDGGEQLSAHQQEFHQRKTHDLFDSIDRNTRHVYNGVSPFDLQSIGELGSDRDICDNALFLQTQALERVAMQSPEKLANLWNNKGVALEGIARPIVLNAADDLQRPKQSTNVFTNQSNDDLFMYRSRTPSPSILPRSLRPRTPSPPRPPPKYYDPARYSSIDDVSRLPGMQDIVIGKDGKEYTLPSQKDISKPDQKLKAEIYAENQRNKSIKQSSKRQTTPTHYHQQVTQLGSLLHEKTGFHDKYSYESSKTCSKKNCGSNEALTPFRQHAHAPAHTIPDMNEEEQEELKSGLEQLELGDNGGYLVNGPNCLLHRQYLDADQQRFVQAHEGGFGNGKSERERVVDVYDYREVEDEMRQFQNQVDMIMNDNHHEKEDIKQRKLRQWLREYENNLVRRRIDSEVLVLETMLKIAQRKELSAMNYQAWCDRKDIERAAVLRENRLQRKEEEAQVRLQKELLHLTKKGISYQQWVEEKQALLIHLRQAQERALREIVLRQTQEKLDRSSGLDVAVQKLLKRSWERQKQAWQIEEARAKQTRTQKEARAMKNEQVFQEWLYKYHTTLHSQAKERVKALKKAVQHEQDLQELRAARNVVEYDKWLKTKQQEGMNASEHEDQQQQYPYGLTVEQKVQVTRKGPHTFGYALRSHVQDVDPRTIATKAHAEQLRTKTGKYISGTPFYDLHHSISKK